MTLSPDDPQGPATAWTAPGPVPSSAAVRGLPDRPVPIVAPPPAPGAGVYPDPLAGPVPVTYRQVLTHGTAPALLPSSYVPGSSGYAPGPAPYGPGPYPMAPGTFPVPGASSVPEPYGRVEAPWNPVAIASAVTGALCLIPGLALVSIVTGHVALRQISQTGERGVGLAAAGLVVGYLAVVAYVTTVLAVQIASGWS